MIDELINRIKRKWMRMRLQPIQIFCFHQVSEKYDPLTMWECDWMPLGKFKQTIMQMQEKGISFISLPEAHDRLKHDWFRREKYAVLTADDGYKSLLNVLPWLEEQQIPITLFVNTQYLDGKSWSAINEEQARRVKADVDMLRDVCPKLYLTKDELKQAAALPNVTIGMHGHEHLDATKQAIEDFKENVLRCQEALKDVPNTVPYFAYAWGRHNSETYKVLQEMGQISVLMDGDKNSNEAMVIHRESID